ncbi:acetamidase formamidase [Trichoderma arundinaceum]|uniref:Acetamidase formamidase n=1 Tax=Trichoderma arundinaceum TaxID=490622 RepID=A0A395NYU8_TRIAR|nr:acetamidase formamidase [Trichoderma arundinaceum]
MSWKPIAKTIHHVHHGPESTIHTFCKDNKPLLTVDSGTEVSFDNTHAGFMKLTKDSTAADIAAINPKSLEDMEKFIGPVYVDGPVYVNGAEPGDILKVEILELQTGSWGWTMIFPGMGLLQDEIPGPHLMTFDLPEGQDYAVFKPGIHIPRQPFYGTMGVAPAEGEINALFPRNDIGGNFDCRYLGEGSTMFLPVNVPGALFACADAHFSQGDGEICCTALETTMRSRIRLSVIKGKEKLAAPHYETNPERVKQMVSVAGKGEHGVLTTGDDRDTVIKQAVREVLRWLEEEKGLPVEEGYMLFSIIGNLKMMHELGIGVYTVSASIPLGIFVD